MERKVVTDHIKRACKGALDNRARAQEPDAQMHIVGSVLRLLERGLVWVNGKDDGPDVFPLVQIAPASAPTVQNLVASPDPLLNKFAFALVVKFSKMLTRLRHFT